MMSDGGRNAWLSSLKTGDTVQRVNSSSGSSAAIGVVVEDDNERARNCVAVQFRDGGRVSHYDRWSGRTAFPHGSPAYVGDLSHIIPADADPAEWSDRLRLRYAFDAYHYAYLSLPVDVVRELLGVLERAGFLDAIEENERSLYG